jgi:hypothetical protein
LPLPLGSARERHSRGVLPSRTALSQTMAASIHRAPSSARRQRAGEDVSDWQPGLEAVAFRLWTRVTASPATRATARPAVVSLQGSIDQECVTVQGDVSAAHMGEHPPHRSASEGRAAVYMHSGAQGEGDPREHHNETRQQSGGIRSQQCPQCETLLGEVLQWSVIPPVPPTTPWPPGGRPCQSPR